MCPLKILNKFSKNYFYLFANFSISLLSIDQRSGNFAFDSIFSCNLGLGTFQKKKRGRNFEKSPNSTIFSVSGFFGERQTKLEFCFVMTAEKIGRKFWAKIFGSAEISDVVGRKVEGSSPPAAKICPRNLV